MKESRSFRRHIQRNWFRLLWLKKEMALTVYLTLSAIPVNVRGSIWFIWKWPHPRNSFSSNSVHETGNGTLWSSSERKWHYLPLKKEVALSALLESESFCYEWKWKWLFLLHLKTEVAPSTANKTGNGLIFSTIPDLLFSKMDSGLSTLLYLKRE